MKGLFTDSVIAQLPEADPDVMAVEEVDAVSQLFGQDKRVPAPSLESKPAPSTAHWREPGTPQRGPEPRMKLNAPVAASGGAATPARAVGGPAPAPVHRAPAGAMGGTAPAPVGKGAPPAVTSRTIQGTFGAALHAAAERVVERRAPSAPLSTAAANAAPTVRAPSAPTAPAPTRGAPAGQIAPRAPSSPMTFAAPGGEPTLRPGEPVRRAPSAPIAQPPAASNDNAPRRAQPGPAISQGQPQPRAASSPMEMSSRPPALPKRSGADARGSRLSDLSTPLPATQGGRTVEFDAGQQSSGLELKTEPAQARAEDQARQGRSVPPQARPVDADPTKPRAAAQGRTRPAEHSRSLHPAAAEPAHERIAPPETATSEAEPKVGSDRPSQRPRKNEKRAEARREARRKAAKQLPPPPAPTVKKRWDAARITLAAFVGVVAMSALVLGAALAGWLPLPPSAAAMLGLSQASLARVDGTKPHLVMPSAPEAPAQRPAVVRLDLPAVKPEPAVAPAPQAEAPAAEAAPAPQAEAPAAEAVPAPQAEAPAAEAAPEPQAEEPAAEAAPDAPVAEAAPALPAGTEAMSPAALLNAARARLRAGDAPGAAELLTQALAKDPDDHHAMEALVRAWLAMKRGQDALPYVQQIVKKRPKRAAYRVLEGDVRRSLGDEAGAAAAFREALRLEPDNREAKQKLGS